MDLKINSNIYNHYKSSDEINIESYFDEYKLLIESSNFYKYFTKQKEDVIMHNVGKKYMDKNLLENLTEYCSIKNLEVDGELKRMSKSAFKFDSKNTVDPSVIENLELQTIHYTKRRNKLKSGFINLKYDRERVVSYEKHEQHGEQLKVLDDIIVYIRVYNPYLSSYYKDGFNQNNKLSVNTVIAMYGSQTLDELRDKINCLSDYSVLPEMSKKPLRTQVPNAKDIYKSGFFYFEGIFYNDCRYAENKDNSKVIREWAEKHHYGKFHTARMENTTIDSLNLRFGYPYVYQHQGDCEHLIVFSDAKLVNVTDELQTECYPRITRIKPMRNRYCMTCGLYNAAWIVKKSKRLPHDPCLFCESCFISYNYIKGEKIGNFEAYPYPTNIKFLQLN